MSTTTIELSKETIAKIAELAKAVDDWMAPTDEASAAARKDFGLYCQEEQEGWEQTDHYHIRYQSKMIEWAHEEAEAAGNPIAWLGYLEEIESLFWEEWGNQPHIYEYWEKIQP